MSARGYYWVCGASLIVGFWLAGLCALLSLVWDIHESPATYIALGAGVFAIYCSSAGSYLIELERVEEDWDRLNWDELNAYHEEYCDCSRQREIGTDSQNFG